MKKAKGLGPLIAAHAKYKATLKQYRNLRTDVAAHIASALPKGTAVQWTQGTAFNDTSTRFELGSVLVFDEMDASYYLEDGAKPYRNEVPCMSKPQLQKLIKLWDGIPQDILDIAFSDAVVRVDANGKCHVEET